jgi:hypothetical protein
MQQARDLACTYVNSLSIQADRQVTTGAVQITNIGAVDVTNTYFQTV